jgi:lysophospholipase L1-like esterase
MKSERILTPKIDNLDKDRSASKSGFNHVLLGKTGQTIIILITLASLPYVFGGLGRYRVVSPSRLWKILKIPSGSAAELSSEETESIEDESSVDSQSASVNVEAKPGEIEDMSGKAMDHFFQALLKSESERGIVRICHYGDSPITNDGITSTVRRQFQMRFGDAGHGFVLIAKPWAWYGHTGIRHDANRAWDIDLITDQVGERYGLGCVRFTSRGAGGVATFGTADEGAVGHSVSAFEIFYLTHPNGGDFSIEIDGVAHSRVSTASNEIGSGFYRAQVNEGPHKMTIRTSGNGIVRLFGVALEAGTRGVVYDSLGFNGMFTSVLASYMDEEHWGEQLRHRKPDLIILAYGTNESQFERLPMDEYVENSKELVRRIRAALPETAILFVGPMDRGGRGTGGKIITRRTIPRLVNYQRRIAAETGCAFFDTFTAMGGEGTVARWHEQNLHLMGGDFTHPTTLGAETIGNLIYEALMKAYGRYKERQPQP